MYSHEHPLILIFREIELSSNVDESPSSAELPLLGPRRSGPGIRRCRSIRSANEEPGPSQRMRFDEPPPDVFGDLNEINHELFMAEHDNIDDNDPLDLHNT